MLHSAQEQLRKSEHEQRELALTRVAILDAIPANIALLDPAGDIVAVNATWRRFGAANGLSSDGLGLNYLKVCDQATGADADEAPAVAAGIRQVLDGTLGRYVVEYPCHSPDERRWFRLTATPLHETGAGGAVLMHQDISARRFAEFAAAEAADVQATLVAELAIERARLVAAQAVAKVGSWETDLRTEEVLWSAETYRIFGRDPIGFHPTHQAFLEHCHPDDRARVDQAFQASANTRELSSLDHRIVLADGSIKQVEERWRTLVDSKGTPARAVGTCQDISERVQSAAELEENQVLLRVATSLSKVGAFRVLLADGRRRWSDEVCAIFEVPPGYTPDLEEALAFYAVDDRAQIRTIFEACGREGIPYDEELPILTRGGRQRWIRTIGEAVRDPSGAVIGIHGAVQDVTERRAATEALRASEERFRVTFDSAPMGIVVTATDGLFHDANIPFRQMIGYTSAQLRNRQFLDLTHPEDRAASIAAAATILNGQQESLVLEKRYLAADGHTVWARVSIAAPRDRTGRALYFVTMVEDITGEQAARVALAASEERFRLLSKAANDAIYDWDIAANTTWYNEGYALLYGLEYHTLAGTAEAWARLIHAEDRDRVWSSLRHALDTGAETWSCEYRFLRGNGNYAHVQDRGYIVRDAGGRATRMIGAHTDLTSRKEVVLHLAQQAALLDAAHDAIMVKDMAGQITYWNKGAERTFGWLASEALGRRASDLLGLDPALREEAHTLLLEQGQWEGERVERDKQGRLRDTSVRLSLLRDDKGLPTSILAITTDVTDRKRLEMQFLRAQRLESLGTLAGGIAHDLNNVLAPILVSIELLRTEETEAERMESLATIESSAMRGAAMVQQVLTFARGVEGKRAPIDVGRLADDAEKIARDTFPKNITIRQTVAPDLWTVHGDATQIHQVLMNLLLNARDAMPAGGTLKVELGNQVIDEIFARMDLDARAGRYVALAVSDTGIGIPVSIQERLFEPFFTTKEVGKGTGLGLSTVHTIVRSHGGFIHLYSEVGRGARFTVYFPAILGGEAVPTETVHLVRLPRGKGELILVVDDEESIRSIVRRTLERFNYRVLLASNGAEGVAQFKEHRAEVAVVLTDMAMPVLDGPGMIRTLLGLDPRISIVASSGLASGAGVADAIAAGVTEFISKPYTAETLLTTLDQLLRRREATPPAP